MIRGILEVKIPVNFYKSTSGKTYYASIDLHYDCYRGSSTNSYEEAAEDMQAQILKEYPNVKDGVPKDE